MSISSVPAILLKEIRVALRMKHPYVEQARIFCISCDVKAGKDGLYNVKYKRTDALPLCHQQ